MPTTNSAKVGKGGGDNLEGKIMKSVSDFECLGGDVHQAVDYVRLTFREHV